METGLRWRLGETLSRANGDLSVRIDRLVRSGLCDAASSKELVLSLREQVKRIASSRDLSKEAALHKALSDKTRLKMVYMLLGRELCECEVMAALSLSQPTASHHLGILARAGVISRKKKGKWVFYKARPNILAKAVKPTVQ